MFMLYADASGNAELTDGEQHYVLAGLCLHESAWHKMEERLGQLKREFEFPGVPMELHAKDFCRSISEQDGIDGFLDMDRESRRTAVLSVRKAKLDHAPTKAIKEELRKKFKETNPFIHLSRIERSRLFEAALDIVGSMDGLRLFAEIIDKKYLLGNIINKEDQKIETIIRHAFEQLVSRFDAFLVNMDKYTVKQAWSEQGILIMDEEKKSENILYKLLKIFREDGHTWGTVTHVIDAPFFVDSSQITAVQAVDLVAYAIRRYIRKTNRNGSHEEANFMRIYHKFDRAGAKLHGIRHYCMRRSCDCRVCSDRGHAAIPVAEVPPVGA
jgi:hypothetical protein